MPAQMAKKSDEVPQFKLVMVGDATVGKTHLLARYIKGTLPKSPAATIGVEFATRTVPLAVGGNVRAQIWDTAGQERYRAITSAHYRRAQGAVLVYDVTRADTFRNVPNWLEELRNNAEPDVVVMLVGNKMDKAESDPNSRQVEFERAQDFAHRNNLLFCESSAVTSVNVKHIFEFLLQEVYNKSLHAKMDARDYSGATRESGGVTLESRKKQAQEAKGSGCGMQGCN
uniref:Uncharacterized protein n=1 Tax=Chromera velia CCMP2878 TaxID=1169474 RepID=A0A0G4G139_9ALVE|mmetsp:Transcript_24108/g.47332  ORF Transcript_24108/g.47332 Transcript_24108/m.47332 type:complete len:228 (+) Transcript_24108:307-990(+)|eukprot:Cvel_19723.t1-p1 / transcript=Cvel_19723.t1 / gene=Cvel_19723 / organism=Chromera_velia_CCMP2878 / gene_product=GTP-binding protein YPT31/YPT8, putative / transcript_product=GTP-binding protein YPT31/YPT8, putative / location=Cvel_scaffold1724:766-3905(-) / protein_length=227 / sequence_SO=supercontig / SO=protein_coding / is_pseudo=false